MSSSVLPRERAVKDALRPCEVCGSTQVELVHHQRFTVPDDFLLPREYDIVCCRACSFAYADTSASQADYDHYYAVASKYEDNATSTGGGTSDWDRQRLAETASAIAAVVQDRATRIADIGCANGGLLAELKFLGFDNLLGIDPSPRCATNVQSTYGIDAVTGSLRTVPSAGPFDVIVLSHVLEHVAALQSTLRDLLPLLSDNGLIYAEVPDASRYSEFVFAPFQDFNTEHINHFAPHSLSNLFRTAGFETISLGQKDIHSSADCPYPALFGFFRRTATVEDAAMVVPNPQFRQQLQTYVERSSDKLEDIDRKIRGITSTTGSIIVWGTGQLAMKLFAETSLHERTVSAVVDSNPINQNRTFAGVPVIAPGAIVDQESPILIATTLHHREIVADIKRLGLANPVVTLA